MTSETSKSYLEKLIIQATKELGFNLSSVQVTSPEPRFGDYSTNAALVLARQEKKNPKEVSAQIIEKIKAGDEHQIFENIAEAAGFINFKLSKQFLADQLSAILEKGQEYGTSNIGKGEKVLVEYFQPNIAKPLHLGHLRTAIIGDSIFRILSSLDFKTESDTHLGDWGTQFGILLYGYKKYGNEKVIEQNPIVELNKLYVKVNQEIEKNSEIKEKGKAEFVKLEQGDKQNRKLWQKFVDWSWQEFSVIYDDFGIRKHDYNWSESFFEDKMPGIVEELKNKKLLEESEGAQVVNLEGYNLGIAIIIKSDGGTTYLLRDLATFIYRKSQGFKQQLYVVDVRQKHTLAQTFKILELLGHISNKEEAVHIAYGFLSLPEGAMSSRKGTAVTANELISNAENQTLIIIQAKNPGLKDKEKVAKQVATAAIKYFDLSHNIKSDIVFEAKKALSFEGNTGPYLQYTHARIHGILRKANSAQNTVNSSLSTEHLALSTEELLVLRKLHQFPEVVERAGWEFQPNIICSYLFELSQSFNSFYQTVPVLKEESEQLKIFRLKLVTATGQVIKNGLQLLGIEAPKEM